MTNVTIENSVVGPCNGAGGSNGGSLFNAGGTFILENVSVENSFVYSNNPDVFPWAYSGGGYCDQFNVAFPSTSMKNVSFTNCATLGYNETSTYYDSVGGAIASYAGNLELDGVSITDCSAKIGGAVTLISSTATFSNIDISNNEGLGGGGIVVFGDAGFQFTNALLNITNAQFVNNTGGYLAGAISFISNGQYWLDETFYAGNTGEFDDILITDSAAVDLENSVFDCASGKTASDYITIDTSNSYTSSLTHNNVTCVSLGYAH